MPRPGKVNALRDPLTREWIQRAAARADVRLFRDGVDLRRLRRRGFEAASLDRAVVAQHNRRYSLELPCGEIRNQEQSGRCWLFAPVVLAQTAALHSGRITANACFSETYLYFFSLVEQARATLSDLRRITERKDSFSVDTFRRNLSGEVMGLGDGGEWEWAFALIEKYGLVPARCMPETASSKSTKALAVDLHECFARAARARTTTAGNGTLWDRSLGEIVRVLVAHLGCPPSVIKHRTSTLSPTEYAANIVGFRPAEWRVVINNPLLPFERVYERRATAITDDSPHFNLRRLNVSQRRLRDLVCASLDAGFAVGCSADVQRNDIDHDRGIMHPAVFNRSQVYGTQTIRDLPRRDDIYLGIASSNHAMAIAGLDRDAGASAPKKYRVLNSWGTERGDHGVYHMYAEWFEENVFKIAVHASVLTDRERAAYADPEPLPGDHFY